MTLDWHTLATSVPAAITAFVSITVAFVSGAIKLAKMWRAVQDKRMASEPPVAPMPPVALPSPAFGHEVTGKLLDALEKRTEWVVADYRKQLEECEREKAEMAADARRTATALMVAEREARSAEAEVYTLENALSEWRGKAAQYEAEAERLRAQQRKDRVDPDTIVTPLRPPKGRP